MFVGGFWVVFLFVFLPHNHEDNCYTYRWQKRSFDFISPRSLIGFSFFSFFFFNINATLPASICVHFLFGTIWSTVTLLLELHAVNFTSASWAAVSTSFPMKRDTHRHTHTVGASRCVHTMNCKCCCQRCKVSQRCCFTMPTNILRLLYMNIFNDMTQDLVDFIVFSNLYFILFFTCMWLFRLLPLKKEIITTEHANLVEVNSHLQLK